MVRVQYILDGYTQSLKIRDQTVLFRRMLTDERKTVLLSASKMLNGSAMKFLEDAVQSRIVWGDIDFRGLSPSEVVCIITEVTGTGTSPREQADVSNLFDGVVIEKRYPWLARKSCDYCRKWWWSPLTNVLARDGVDGPAFERDPAQTLLCADGRCPKGTPEKPKTLSMKNRWAWKHFQQCEAVGQFPDDPIVRRNAQVIRAAIQSAMKKAG